jgi:predicted nucleotidyltransferase
LEKGWVEVTQRQGTDTALLREVVRRIRAAAEPQQVILFGSRARDAGHADSDLDLLIVMDTDLPRHRRPLPFYEALAGLGLAKDIVVYTPSEVEDWKTASCSLVATALREGRVLYENQP